MISPNAVVLLFHPSIHGSMGSAPVGSHCPLTSSLGEFPGYKNWLWYPGLSPVLVSITFFPSPSISRGVSIHSSSPSTELHSCFFFTTVHSKNDYAPGNVVRNVVLRPI